MSDWSTIEGAEALEPGSKMVAEVDGTMVAVVNLDGVFYAMEDVCTHDGGDLASGELDGDELVCPRHGARFCVKNGQAMCAPAYEDVYCFPVRIEKGTVQVRDDRWD